MIEYSDIELNQELERRAILRRRAEWATVAGMGWADPCRVCGSRVGFTHAIGNTKVCDDCLRSVLWSAKPEEEEG